MSLSYIYKKNGYTIYEIDFNNIIQVQFILIKHTSKKNPANYVGIILKYQLHNYVVGIFSVDELFHQLKNRPYKQKRNTRLKSCISQPDSKTDDGDYMNTLSSHIEVLKDGKSNKTGVRFNKNKIILEHPEYGTTQALTIPIQTFFYLDRQYKQDKLLEQLPCEELPICHFFTDEWFKNPSSHPDSHSKSIYTLDSNAYAFVNGKQLVFTHKCEICGMLLQ
jgi:hypothetical protein